MLGIEPYAEDALGETLRLLTSLGREREAHRRYEEFALRLRRELGQDPLPATGAWKRA